MSSSRPSTKMRTWMSGAPLEYHPGKTVRNDAALSAPVVWLPRRKAAVRAVSSSGLHIPAARPE